MEQRTRDRASALLIVAGGVAAVAMAIDWFVLPAPSEQIRGFEDLRDARHGAVVVLAAALAWWVRAVLRRDRAEPVPSLRLTGVALVLGAIVLLCAPYVAYTERSWRNGALFTETAVCPGVVHLSATPFATGGSFSCEARREPRLITVTVVGVVGLVLQQSARRRRTCTGPLAPRAGHGGVRGLRAIPRTRAQLWVVPMVVVLVRMLTLESGRFFLFGKTFSVVAAGAATLGWTVVVDRSTRRDDPRRSAWLAGVLLLELAALWLLTPYDIGSESCASPLVGGASLSGLVEPTGCLFTGLLVVLAATGMLVTGSVLVLRGPRRERPEPVGDRDSEADSWAAAP